MGRWMPTDPNRDDEAMLWFMVALIGAAMAWFVSQMWQYWG